ncbi:hypothetical protein [Streptomyces flavofungini]|uniref:hypothetical protein n=1 Tax=Streptomyces flavofungini TaxID=68200 RepID=UPI0034DFF90F
MVAPSAVPSAVSAVVLVDTSVVKSVLIVGSLFVRPPGLGPAGPVVLVTGTTLRRSASGALTVR